MSYPNPDTLHPVTLPDGSTLPNNVFLKAVIDHPCIEVGDYTYASDFDPPADPKDWAGRIAPFIFGNSQDRLVIGKFGQFAHGVRFITNSANHKKDGFSTYPFAIHDPKRLMTYPTSLPRGRDISIGHDVWLGMNALILPGAQIGNGVIVSAGSVVAGVIPDYAVIGGNRADILRMRFASDVVSRLNRIAWWDWPIERIIDHEGAIIGGDIVALEAAAP